MEKPQQTGLFIMIGAAFAMVVFLWSITRRSYMALALPVMGAVGAVSALAFWIGWTMFTAQDEDEDDLDEIDEADAA